MATDFATITITVEPTVNAMDDTATTQVGQAVTVPVLANDTVNGLPATVADLDGPPTVEGIYPEGAGTATVDPVTGDIEFTPAAGFCGSVLIGYGIERNCCVLATVSKQGDRIALQREILGDLPGFEWGVTEQIDLTDHEGQGPLPFVYSPEDDMYVLGGDYSLDCSMSMERWTAQVPGYPARCALVTADCRS